MLILKIFDIQIILILGIVISIYTHLFFTVYTYYHNKEYFRFIWNMSNQLFTLGIKEGGGESYANSL